MTEQRAAAPVEPAPISLGWAHTSITPDQPVQLHGQLYERVMSHVNDPCTATVLAIESQPASGAREQAIVISCDLVNFDGAYLKELRSRVGAQLPDFEASKLLVCATHTHTGPTMMEGLYNEPPEGVMRPSAYSAFLLDKLEAAAVEAWQSRRPGSISSAVGQAVIGFNRRVVYKDGSAKMYGSSNTPDFKEIEGASDPQVEILFAYDEGGKLAGVVACPACPAQVVEGQMFLSADFWGVARELLRDHFGEHLNVVAMTGAAGDQSPRDLVRRGRGEPNMRDLDGMREMGRRLANAIVDAHQHSQTTPQRELVFRHRQMVLSLPRRKATQAEAQQSQEMIDDILKRNPEAARTDGKDRRWILRYQDAIDRYNTQGDDPRYDADVHFMRLGDIAIATCPFELYLDFSFQIKARSKALQTFVVQLTNDRAIYLPTEKAVKGGSYGAMIYDNICGPQGGDELVRETVQQLNAFWD